MNNKRHRVLLYQGFIWPIVGGGTARIWAMIRYLRQAGYAVDLVAKDHGEYNAEIAAEVDSFSCCAREKPASELNQMPPPPHKASGPPGPPARDKALELLAGEVAYRERPVAAIASFVWTVRALDYMPPCTLRILDTIDVQHVRAQRAREAGGNLDHITMTREQEIKELRRADVLMAIQEEEQRIFQEMCPNQQVICVKHAIEIPPYVPSSAPGNRILFIANNYDPNIQGLTQFFETTWPVVLRLRPEATITVCGRISEAFAGCRFPNAIFTGAVPDLRPYYEESHLVINPVLYGTGLKIKSVEALCHGRNLVCTAVGIQGLEDSDDLPVAVTNLGEDMARRIVQLFEEDARRHQQEQRVCQYARKHFGMDAIFADLMRCIKAHENTRP